MTDKIKRHTVTFSVRNRHPEFVSIERGQVGDTRNKELTQSIIHKLRIHGYFDSFFDYFSICVLAKSSLSLSGVADSGQEVSVSSLNLME